MDNMRVRLNTAELIKRDPERPEAWELVVGDVIAHPYQKGKLARITFWQISARATAGLVRIEYLTLRKDGSVVGDPSLEQTVGFTTLRPSERVRLISSALPTTVPTPTNERGDEPQKGSNMATKVKRSTASKKGAKVKKAQPAAAQAKSNGGTRRTAAEVRKLVPQFVKHLKSGGTMRELKAEHGFSDDGPIRSALYHEGFDSKGQPHGEEADSIDAGKAAGRKQLVALRNEGAGWYRLAYLSGLSESEVKGIIADAGGETGRVYKAPAPKASKAGKAAKGKTTRKATAADPS